MNHEVRKPAQRKLNLLQTLKAVAWGFFGVRKNSGLHEDHKLNPVHLIVAALACTVVFVVGLVLIAQWFISQAA